MPAVSGSLASLTCVLRALRLTIVVRLADEGDLLLARDVDLWRVETCGRARTSADGSLVMPEPRMACVTDARPATMEHHTEAGSTCVAMALTRLGDMVMSGAGAPRGRPRECEGAARVGRHSSMVSRPGMVRGSERGCTSYGS